jgi:hypothetical protein
MQRVVSICIWRRGCWARGDPCSRLARVISAGEPPARSCRLAGTRVGRQPVGLQPGRGSTAPRLRFHCSADIAGLARLTKPMACGLSTPEHIGVVQNTSPVSQFTSRPCVPTCQPPAITRIPTWHHRCLTHPALTSTTVRIGQHLGQEAAGRSERGTRLGQVAGSIKSEKPWKE